MNEFNFHVPEYKLEEKEKEIFVTITAPLSKPKEAALVLEKNNFVFDSPPYLLSIKLPHPVSDRFSQQAYDKETCTYKIKFKKVNASPEDSSSEEEENEFTDLLETDKEKTNSDSENHDTALQFYGFCNKYSNMFGKLYDEFSDIINLPQPDKTSVAERRRLRIEEENEKWSDDHYLADTMETNHLESIFEYKPPWSSSSPSELNEDEKEMMSEIRSSIKCKNLSDEEKKMSEFQIVDVLYCYAYNKRTTEGDNTVESAWTINKLSSTLSWFEIHENLRSVIVTCYRRSLIYPLYRNWNLCQAVQKDVVCILKNGPVQVTKCFLEVRELFNDSDNRYVLNTLYVNDLCDFAFQTPKDRYTELSSNVEKISIKKHEINSDLQLLEVAAVLTLEEETGKCNKNSEDNLKRVVDEISKLDLRKGSSSTESDSNSDSTESDSDSESSQSSDNKN